LQRILDAQVLKAPKIPVGRTQHGALLEGQGRQSGIGDQGTHDLSLNKLPVKDHPEAAKIKGLDAKRTCALRRSTLGQPGSQVLIYHSLERPTGFAGLRLQAGSDVIFESEGRTPAS